MWDLRPTGCKQFLSLGWVLDHSFFFLGYTWWYSGVIGLLEGPCVVPGIELGLAGADEIVKRVWYFPWMWPI